MSGPGRTAAGLFAAAVLVRLGFWFFSGYTADDAFITFRYAENLATGNGFVYNLGDRVLGTTTPLFTLLLAITTLLRIPIIYAALIISLVASGLTVVYLYKLSRALRFTHFAILPALMYIAWPRSITTDISGMESALFTLFVTAAFYYQHKRQEIYALGLATLATVTRPEGLGLLGLLLVYNFYRDRSLWLRYLMTPLIILGPWLIFAWLYFGSPIPNSVVAKLALYSRFGTMPPLEAFSYLFGLHTLLGWLILPLFPLGVWIIDKKQNAGRLEATWIVATLLFYTFSRTHVFHWYISPIYPVMMLFVASGIQYLLELLRMPSSRVRVLNTAAALLILAGLSVGIYRQALYYKDYQTTLEQIHRAIGYFLHAETEPDALVAAEDIGYMGYYSKRRILDRDGLVSPEAIPYNRDGRYLDLLTEQRPDYLVAALVSSTTPFMEDQRFTLQFEELKRFPYRTQEYRVYKRRS